MDATDGRTTSGRFSSSMSFFLAVSALSSQLSGSARAAAWVKSPLPSSLFLLHGKSVGAAAGMAAFTQDGEREKESLKDHSFLSNVCLSQSKFKKAKEMNTCETMVAFQWLSRLDIVFGFPSFKGASTRMSFFL